jgi:hypothetical protein
MFLQILVINGTPLLKPREIKGREKKNRVDALRVLRRKLSLSPNSIHEKEILFPIRTCPP